MHWMNPSAVMYTVVTKIMQIGSSPQKSGFATHTSARSRGAVARVVGLLVLVLMPQLSSCTQMHGIGRLQLSMKVSKHRGHREHHVTFAMHPEEKESAINGAPQQPVLLQVSEDQEEIQKINRTVPPKVKGAVTPTQWPWIQPGSITKKSDATTVVKQVATDSTPVVTASKATSGFEIQSFHRSDVSQSPDVKVGAQALDPTVSSGFQIATSDRSDISDQDTDDTASGSTENIVQGLAAIQQQLPSMMMKLNGGPIALPACIAAAVFATVIVVWLWASLRWSKATGPRSIVEALKLSYGAQLENLLQAKERYDNVMQTPLSQGNVLRIQGRVVPGAHGSVTSPLWQRESVMYSASVTPKSTNGKYGSPMTVHSCSVDFAIQLLDAPHIQLAVCGQDAMLFDMKRGVYEKDLTLAQAGENWQDFVLNHAGPERASAALESEDLLFQFREVALSLGAVVTCVGEVRRDQYGILSLCPWQKKGYTTATKDSMTDGYDPFGSDFEKVMISDDSSLFPKSSKNTIPWDCCADNEDEGEGDAAGPRPVV